MQAMVHAKTCIQCGLCPAVCPDVFTLEPGEPARAISGENLQILYRQKVEQGK